MAKVDAAKLKFLAHNWGLTEVRDAAIELEDLRSKVGRMKITIKKKDHVIRTIDHHNNRLKNHNRAVESCNKCRDKEIELLLELLNSHEIQSELMNFSKRVEIARKALAGESDGR